MSGNLKHTVATYLRPREKAKQKGIGALSDSELVQLIIGSGTVQFTVASIARRVARLLKHHGSSLDASLIATVPGLGPARIAQLSAVLELAARYPVKEAQEILQSPEAIIRCMKSTLQHPDLWLVTLDGARRMLEHRAFGLDSIAGILREASLGIVRDKASHIVFLRYTDEQVLLPEMFDLSLARESRQLARLLGLGSVEYLICNEGGYYSVMKELKHE